MSGETPAVREALAVYATEAPETERVPLGYRQTEVGVIPEDWEVRPLLGTVRLPVGQVDPRIEPYKSMVLIAPDHVESRTGRLLKKSTASDQRAISGKYLFSPGDIVYSKIRPYLQKAILADFRGLCSADMYPLTPAEGVSPGFVFAVLLGYQFSCFAENVSARSGIPKINREELAEYSVALPPPSEQRAIAAALSDVDDLIAALDRLIAKKRAVKTAAMQQLLTAKQRLPGFSGEWETKRLGDVFIFLSTANNPRSDLSEHGEIGYVHYGDLHASNSSFLDCSRSRIPHIVRGKVKDIPLLEEGDLVMADASEDYEGVGKSVEVRNLCGRKLVAGLHTFLLRGNKETLADGFKGYLQCIPSVRSALVRFATGISVYGISKNHVKGIEVELPEVEEQRSIATVLSDMDAEIEALEVRREKTRRIKQGMMQELLTGRTRLV